MKKKEFKKKLSLNKQTISNLNQNDLSKIYGGDGPIVTIAGHTCVNTRCPAHCPIPGITASKDTKCLFCEVYDTALEC